jgi:pimeloyl-ACP methyl ester carboxylesterase
MRRDVSMLHRTEVSGIPRGFKELRYTTGEVTLNYVVGPDNGLALLLVPGQMESWQGYKCVLPKLSETFQVFVPDLRGHGRSTRTPGRYSYNICGSDLKNFIREVIQRPAIVSGLSSGGVLAIWLGANAPEDVLAVIGEDPPIFSSVWPRIQDERFMFNSFRMAVDPGKPGERDIGGLHKWGPCGKTELLRIPPVILKIMFFLYRLNRAVRPNSPYDTPFMPFNIRAGHKFLSEYNTDFSRATIDGDLSKDFNPEDTLKRVKCPMLLMRANASRHETWGLLGAIDDNDLERIVSLVDDLKYVQIPSRHEIHMVQPGRYMDELTEFVDDLRAQRRLPSRS